MQGGSGGRRAGAVSALPPVRRMTFSGPAIFSQAAMRGLVTRGYARVIVRRLARMVEGEWADASRMPLDEWGGHCGPIAARADRIAEDALALGDLRTAERACGVSTMCHALHAFASGQGRDGPP